MGGGTGSGGDGVYPDFNLQAGLGSALQDLADRSNVPVVSPHCDTNVPVISEAMIRGVEAGPAKPGKPAFHPGVARGWYRLFVSLSGDV